MSVTSFHVRRGTTDKIAYSVSGDGPAIVLLHPIGVDRSWWAAYVQHLNSSHRVIAIDLPGHGESSPIAGSISLAAHAAAVLEIIEAESAGPAVLLGVSMGGMVAQRVAIAATAHVSALILCATAGGFPDAARAAIRSRGDTSRSGDMSEVIDATIRRWFTPDSPPELVARCRARLAADDWHSWSANWEAISQLENLSDLSTLALPALVIACERDASIPVTVSAQLSQALRCDMIVIEGSGHFGAFDSPQRFMPAIDRFLGRLRSV